MRAQRRLSDGSRVLVTVHRIVGGRVDDLLQLLPASQVLVIIGIRVGNVGLLPSRRFLVLATVGITIPDSPTRLCRSRLVGVVTRSRGEASDVTTDHVAVLHAVALAADGALKFKVVVSFPVREKKSFVG